MTRRLLFSFVACSALSVNALAQEQERALAQVQVGLERALKIPLEIIMLRAAVREEAWRNDRRLKDGLVTFRQRIVLADLERTTLVASFANPQRCDLRPG
jgi:hypothetical protein